MICFYPLPLCLLLLMYPDESLAIGPITSGIAVSLASMGIYWAGDKFDWASDKLECYLTEDCCPQSFPIDRADLFERLFDRHIYGQHIVKNIVGKALRSRFRKSSQSASKKALVFSFHGWTGSGKNYVTKIMAESLFPKGLRSKYVHLYVGPLHFPLADRADIYKIQLQDEIRGNVSKCARHLFIFDEVDKMPEKVIDGLKAFMDFHENVGGVDFRHSIFLFISNVGGTAITRVVYEEWKNGKTREDITYADMEDLVRRGAFNEAGGLHFSEVIFSHLIDHYVPFLPLEKTHVLKCAKAEFANRLEMSRVKEVTSDHLDSIVNAMSYWPEENPIFSSTGCKSVSQKVDMILEDILLREQQIDDGDSRLPL